MLLVVLGFFVFSACEDVIDVELQEGETSLVVDGWIDNLAREQVITLTLSQAFFDNTTPTGIEDAMEVSRLLEVSVKYWICR